MATVSNLLDGQLQGRAAQLHGNAAGLERQGRDVARATAGLRRDTDRLAREAADAGRVVKELGNVQNWAEVLERDFLVLEDTVRRVRQGGGSSDDGDGEGEDGSAAGSCSCSECWSGGSDSDSGGGGGEDGSRRESREDGARRSRVEVDLSDAIIESLSDAMATETFFTPDKAAARGVREGVNSSSTSPPVTATPSDCAARAGDLGARIHKGKGPVTAGEGSSA